MMTLHEMIQYLVDFEWRGKSFKTSIWAANPDSVVEMMIGDKAQAADFVKIISIKRVDNEEK